MPVSHTSQNKPCVNYVVLHSDSEDILREKAKLKLIHTAPSTTLTTHD